MSKYDRMTDEQLLCDYKNGNQEIMDYLMVKYKSMVRKKARAMYLLGGENEDLIQEGMIGLIKAVRDFDVTQKTSFSSFAELCVSRQMYSAIEASNRKKHLPLNSYISLYEDSEQEGEGRSLPLIDTIESSKENDPEVLYFGKEYTEAFAEQLKELLSPLENHVLYLHLMGTDYRTIAELLGKSPKSVDNALRGSRQKHKRFCRKGEIRMKKKYNYLLALAVFLVIMICFNKFGYIISYLAAIGGSLVMGNNGTMVVYEFLMSHLNLVSAILYLMVLPIPALWYYLAFQLREGGIRAIPGKCRRVGWDGCVLIALFTFGMIHVTSIILAIVARSLPDAMDNYQNLIENSGLTEYSLMWVFSTLILPPLVEEMIFRGLIQKYLERAGMHWILANVVQAVLFGVFHQNLVQGIYAALLGFALGFVAHRYNTLAASMLMHMFYNLMGTLIVDLESRFLPTIVMGMIILISIPMTVSAVTLICLTTNNKKTEV